MIKLTDTSDQYTTRVALTATTTTANCFLTLIIRIFQRQKTKMKRTTGIG